MLNARWAKYKFNAQLLEGTADFQTKLLEGIVQFKFTTNIQGATVQDVNVLMIVLSIDFVTKLYGRGFLSSIQVDVQNV